MIQPTYGPPPPTQTSYAELKTGYAVPSAILSGGNLALSIAQLSRQGSHRGWAYTGLVSGGGQLIWGLANIRKAQFTAGVNGSSSYTRYRAQNNLSYLNIALGTATMVTSGLQLAMRKKMEKGGLPVSVYGFPNEANSMTWVNSTSSPFSTTMENTPSPLVIVPRFWPLMDTLTAGIPTRLSAVMMTPYN